LIRLTAALAAATRPLPSTPPQPAPATLDWRARAWLRIARVAPGTILRARMAGRALGLAGYVAGQRDIGDGAVRP
jgi:hypothetical protein